MRISIIIVLGISACSTPTEPDAGAPRDSGTTDDAGAGCAATCAGCCDAAGKCVAGFSSSACGRSGVACAACAAGSSCVNGLCDAPDSGCFASAVPGAAWATLGCPDAGCPSGSTCLRGWGESGGDFGCVPMPAQCNGTPSCACMSCVCSILCEENDAGMFCNNGTISRRELKRDVDYVTDAERSRIAAATLAIPLARFHYRGEAQDARERLGFVIDDQPTPSPAVENDRLHVDGYGYTSMLLATIQQQQRELEALRARIEALEKRRR